MGRLKWTAWQKGRIVDDGVIDASSERDGIRDLLGSREWKGNDWRLRVGGASITFDAEDVSKLAGEVGDDHAEDTALPGEPVPKEIVQAAVDAVIKNKVRPEKQLGQLTDKSLADSYIMVDALKQMIRENGFEPVQADLDAARRMIDEHTIRHLPNPLHPLRGNVNQVLASINTPCCAAPVLVSVDCVEPLKSRPRVMCPACRKRYELQVTGVSIYGQVPGNGVLVQGVFHPDAQPASTTITQAFARLGLPAGAAVYALRKMSVPSENVRDLQVSGDDIFVAFLTNGRLKPAVCHFTRAELEAAW